MKQVYSVVFLQLRVNHNELFFLRFHKSKGNYGTYVKSVKKLKMLAVPPMGSKI